MPSRAYLMIADGEEVAPGDILAKIPRESTRTKDITGGLPRVVELFEARKPRETATIAEIDGVIRFGDVVKGQRKIYITGDNGEEREYSVPRSIYVNVQEGERLAAGEKLFDGPLNPHDVLAVLGEQELQRYLVNEIQEVYRLQGVAISDKHIETIVRQMLRWVKVDEVGDTNFLLEQQIDRFRFNAENDRVTKEGGRIATGRPLLLGITKASLSTDSFISAASFQETTRVLTEASINGAVDTLRGLKENVIVGRLIPAGTGMEYYRNVQLSPSWKKRQQRSSRKSRKRTTPKSASSRPCAWKASRKSSPPSNRPKRGAPRLASETWVPPKQKGRLERVGPSSFASDHPVSSAIPRQAQVGVAVSAPPRHPKIHGKPTESLRHLRQTEIRSHPRAVPCDDRRASGLRLAVSPHGSVEDARHAKQAHRHGSRPAIAQDHALDRPTERTRKEPAVLFAGCHAVRWRAAGRRTRAVFPHLTP